MAILSTLQWFMAIRVNAHCLLKQSERLWERRGHHPRIAAQLAQHCGFASHRHIHALHQLNGTFVACIHATAKQLQLTEGLERQLQALGHRFGQRLRRVIQPQCDLVNANQRGATSSSTLQFGRRQTLRNPATSIEPVALPWAFLG